MSTARGLPSATLSLEVSTTHRRGAPLRSPATQSPSRPSYDGLVSLVPKAGSWWLAAPLHRDRSRRSPPIAASSLPSRDCASSIHPGWILGNEDELASGALRGCPPLPIWSGSTRVRVLPVRSTATVGTVVAAGRYSRSTSEDKDSPSPGRSSWAPSTRSEISCTGGSCTCSSVARNCAQIARRRTASAERARTVRSTVARPDCTGTAATVSAVPSGTPVVTAPWR